MKPRAAEEKEAVVVVVVEIVEKRSSLRNVKSDIRLPSWKHDLRDWSD
jgi:hypothetical protein